MKPIPYVLIKSAMTLDGYIDDASDKRFIISNEKDFAEVEKIRESCDAILVGAKTIRKDNPKLILKSGKNLKKITITHSGNLNPESNFFTTGTSEKIVYTTPEIIETLKQKIPNATIVAIPTRHPELDLQSQIFNFRSLLENLFERGVKRLLVEGGSTIITEFLQEGLVDELQISIAGLLLGQKNAPRLIKDGLLQNSISLQLQSLKVLDDMVVFSYKPKKNTDELWMKYVIDLSKNCPSCDTAFAVGAALVDNNGEILAEGCSRETNPTIHAEEVVLQKIADQHLDLSQATLYTSLEPCTTRSSQSESCVDLILKYEINRIVFAAKEPPVFVQENGAKELKNAGKEIVILSQFENEVIKIQSPSVQKKWEKILSTI